MLYIDSRRRAPMAQFHHCLYRHLKANELRYSDQRERVLKVLHKQSYPATIDKLLRLLNAEQYKGASYPTVVRHINFFAAMGWLKVVEKVHREYLLVLEPPKCREEAQYEDVEAYDPL